MSNILTITFFARAESHKRSAKRSGQAIGLVAHAEAEEAHGAEKAREPVGRFVLTMGGGGEQKHSDGRKGDKGAAQAAQAIREWIRRHRVPSRCCATWCLLPRTADGGACHSPLVR